MKKGYLKTSIVLALTAFGTITMTGCKGSKEPTVTAHFGFSAAIESGRTVLEVNKTESITIYDNGIDNSGRNYVYSSNDEDVATIDSNGVITAKAPGKVNFTIVETNSGLITQLPVDLTVVPVGVSSNGGFNYAGASTDADLDRRAEILSKLEKYAMDTHLTGITLFDNGGYVKYSNRVRFPGGENPEYVTGYGFGLLTEGELVGTLSGSEFGGIEPTYYHSSIAQDSLKIDQYTATGSQVGDLASYITSSYWGTKLGTKVSKDGKPAFTYYEWYPVLAANKVKLPKRDEQGKLIYQNNELQFENEAAEFGEPIPMEDKNNLGLYKKWRIYVKTDGDINGSVLKYHANSQALKDKGFDNRGVSIEDYKFIYKYLFTGSNKIIRGTEMANDTSYGIKGAQRYFNDTKELHKTAEIDQKWLEYTTPDPKTGATKLGVQVGSDSTNGAYIDLELINAIDPFTAMYTLSSSLTSPLPEDFFVGANSISGDTMEKSAKKYGNFNSGGDNAILDYTLCCGPYFLKKWAKNQEIVFQRNDDWFDYKDPVTGQFTGRYKIPGVYNRVIDTSTDTEKNWKQFNAGNLDSVGIPSKKVKEFKDGDNVFATKGDSTFKLNVNSCTQEQWDYNFGANGKINKGSNWNVKPWMSNTNFLNGLFFSINRKEFAEARGVAPSINYFSDAYLADPQKGTSYNDTKWHREAVAGYTTFDENGKDVDFGYDINKAIDCFRIAVQELAAQNKITLGTRENPTTIEIHIKWMYQTDTKEYGEDIKSYFEAAFNDEKVCGGKVKLNVTQDAVTNWEEVYNEWMMKGQFDLGFGAISGNTYNPLNFMEVLKSDNSSSFTLNWGADTSKVDPLHAIMYDGKTWSFDGLWEVADHGGIVENGSKIDAVKSCVAELPYKIGGQPGTAADKQDNLYQGYEMEVPVKFAQYEGEGSGKADFDLSHFDIYIYGYGNKTLDATYDKDNDVIRVKVNAELADEINQAIKKANNFKPEDEPYYTETQKWKINPFIQSKKDILFSYELYYTITINDGASSEAYYAVK